MNYTRLLFCFGLAAFTISPTLLTACADDDDDAANDDDASTDDDDNNSTDDDDTTSDDDDDDVTGDDDDVTDDDDNLPACEAITTQAECDTREDCYSGIVQDWWSRDAGAGECIRGSEPAFVGCFERDSGSPAISCMVRQLASGVTAVFDFDWGYESVMTRCALEPRDPACACCDGGEG